MIYLGSKNNAISFYLKQGFTPYLFLQVYDFINIDDVKSLIEKMNLEVIDQAQYDFYGYVKAEVDTISVTLLQTFEQNVDTLKAIYLFEKKL